MSTRLPRRDNPDIGIPGVGLVVALRREASALFGRVRWADFGNRRLCCTLLRKGIPVVVVRSGPGLGNAHQGARWLVSNQVAALGSFGVSGGLSPELGIGDLVLAGEIVRWTGDAYERVWQSDGFFLEPLYGALQAARLPVRLGTLLTVERPLLTIKEKGIHFKESKALAADMESAGVAREAERAGIPFFALRAICDPAGMRIPPFVMDCLDSKGDIRPVYLCAQLLKNPFRVIALLRMRRGIETGLSHLRTAWQGPLQHVLPELVHSAG